MNLFVKQGLKIEINSLIPASSLRVTISTITNKMKNNLPIL